MVSAYRIPPRQLSIAPPAPWWRMLRAWASGTFRLLEDARDSRRYEAGRRKKEEMMMRAISLAGLPECRAIVPRGFERWLQTGYKSNRVGSRILGEHFERFRLPESPRPSVSVGGRPRPPEMPLPGGGRPYSE